MDLIHIDSLLDLDNEAGSPPAEPGVAALLGLEPEAHHDAAVAIKQEESEEDKVFRSMKITEGSKTPYSDATQVIGYRALRNLHWCSTYRYHSFEMIFF